MKIPRHKRTGQQLRVENFGPIRQADVTFSDLTVLVGPQATGKSILLQLLKLLVDTAYIKREFNRAGVDWAGDFDGFLDVYFGEGMRSLWTNRTRITHSGEAVKLPERVEEKRAHRQESMFFIPAQRVLALRDGWPSAFNYYDASVPFTLREFSEHLRLLMSEFGVEGTLFPVSRRLKSEFRDLLQDHIFPGFDLKIDTDRAQKRLVLTGKESGGGGLPVAVWSAGQREFVPLLLGLYYLMVPAKAPLRKGVEWAVVEELEMGLHPRAISVVMLMLFELMARGYRVCISTHSPQVLDAVWTLQRLHDHGASPSSLLEVFNVAKTPPMSKLAEQVMKRQVKVYYFDRGAGITRDISNLDSSAEEAGDSGWGGLTEFSGRASAAVARAVANSDRRPRS
ncbi:MAG: AAA family ATPase [Verrucomicrobiales bacterium]|nr:AAA family ATPase [Verrucomicrobiales bacterium]